MILQNRQIDPDHPSQRRDPSLPVLPLALDSREAHVVSWHMHFRGQLVYASQGVMTVRTEEGTWVVPPQQAVWVPPGLHHQVEAAGEVSKRFIYIHPDRAAKLPATCCVLSVSPLMRELILRVIARADEDLRDPRLARLIEVILDELEALEIEPLHLPLPRDSRLSVVSEALCDDPGDSRSLADWARQAGASERTLARLFAKETGMTFGTWRQRLRLHSAITRLVEGEAVTTVAFDLGYESPSAFIAMFKRLLGDSPSRYLSGRTG